MEHTDLKSMTQQNLPDKNMDHSVSVLPGGFYQIREMQKNV